MVGVILRLQVPTGREEKVYQLLVGKESVQAEKVQSPLPFLGQSECPSG